MSYNTMNRIPCQGTPSFFIIVQPCLYDYSIRPSNVITDFTQGPTNHQLHQRHCNQSLEMMKEDKRTFIDKSYHDADCKKSIPKQKNMPLKKRKYKHEDSSPSSKNMNHVLKRQCISSTTEGSNSDSSSYEKISETSLEELSGIVIPDAVGGKWYSRYEELIEYKNQHGNFSFARNDKKHKQLARWVISQRLEYRSKCEGEKSSLTPARLAALEIIGFDWGRGYDALWKQRYDQLLKFKQEHGHCDVPIGYKENKALGIWVGTQRREYRLNCEGKPNAITPERIDELNKLGFTWCIDLDAKWQNRLDELLEFRQRYGHWRVPREYNENRQLSSWVTHQRKEFWKKREGKESSLTTERMRILESIGFDEY